MSASFKRPSEGVTIPRIWIAVGLSVLLHAALLWRALPQLHHLTIDEPEQGENSGALAVRLAPPPTPRTAPPPEPESAPAPKVIARPPQKQSAPKVIALSKQGTMAQPSAVPAPPVEKTPPAPRSAENDFAQMVEARRRAREGSAPAPEPASSPGMVASAPAETEAERAKRITSANLAPRQQVFGYDPAAGGGVFQIRAMSLNSAEFVFYGWNREIKRKTMQLIEVNRGNNPDIKIAVVRRMIAIIREEVKEDFTWESKRLGRDMTLSARMRDNAYLEDFMLREFFPDSVVAR